VADKLKVLVLGAFVRVAARDQARSGRTHTHLVCLPAEAELINREGAVVRMPVKGRAGLVEVNSKALPGEVTAGGPQGIDPGKYDLVALAMQEPQYRSAGVRELLDAVARSRVPCMSIMNMPPLPYLARIPGVDAKGCRAPSPTRPSGTASIRRT
jgi:hypothetical protein